MNIEELLVRFKADTADFNNKVNSVNSKINQTNKITEELAKKTSQSEQKISSSIQSMSNHWQTLATVITGAGIGITTFAIKVGSDMESAEARIASMVGGVENAKYAISELRDSASQTGSSILTLAENYGKMAVFVESGNISLQESIDLSKGLNVTALALGATSDNLGNVMYGLSQALGSGVVRAEEFNQVMEPLPGLINRVEKANGLASGSLRQMVNDGQLTSEQFKNYLIPALQSFEAQAISMADTVKVQSGRVSSSFVALGEDIYDSLSAPLSTALGLLDAFLQKLTSVERASNAELERRLKERTEKLTFTTNLQKAGGALFVDANSIRKEIADLETQLAKNKNEIINYDAGTGKTSVGLKAPPKPLNVVSAISKSSGGGSSAKKQRVERISEAQREADRLAEIRQNAIAAARETIASTKAEIETSRELENVKKSLSEVYKLESAGVTKNSKEYNELKQALESVFLAQQQMQEKLDLEKYVQLKARENEQIAMQSEMIGMTTLEIEKYNIQKQLQNELEDKSIELTKEGFESYKKQAEAMAEQKIALIEQNKAFEDSFEGGLSRIMTSVKENAVTDAELITNIYESMSQNMTNSLLDFAQNGKASFGDFAGSVISDLNKIALQMAISGLMGQAVGALGGAFTSTASNSNTMTDVSGMTGNINGGGFSFGGYRANGGKVFAGQTYVVGERGQELFTPSQNGVITPNNKINGGQNINVNYTIDARGADSQSASNIARAMQSTKRQTIAEIQSMLGKNSSMTRAVRSVR